MPAIPTPWRWPAALGIAMLPALQVLAASAADYYVENLPGVPKDSSPVKMHAGHIEIEPDHNSNLFFWHFQNKHIANRQRTVIWLNGGPGCSSEDGALMEVGPYRVKDENTLVLNNGSWHEYANLLFVDNPVGTGFSYVDTDSFLHDLGEMSRQFVVFLEKFFEMFPHFEKDDLYIAGESFAGQHIPYIAQAILDHNLRKTEEDKWKLNGLLIGNGWISPYDQYESYITLSLDKGLVEKDSDIHKRLEDKLVKCKEDMAKSRGHVDYGLCESILSDILQLTKKGNGDDACVNMYDVRIRDTYPDCGMNWPPDLKAVTPYLRRTDVISALHVDNRRTTGWQECNSAVSRAFNTHKSKPSVDLLPKLMQDMQILLFSGAEDLICNHFGTEELISNLEWNGGKGFEVTPGNWAPRREWTFEGESAGFWQEARNLTYVLFHQASHMVPFDYPRRSRDMLDRFMNVDIRSIGGTPADSRIDGEKGPETTVGGAYNNTDVTDEEAQEKIDEAKWAAYQKSGEIVLVIVIVAASAWGIFIWRERRKNAAYRALVGDDLESTRFNRAKRGPGNLEPSAFDESELDDLHLDTPTTGVDGKYSLGDDSDDDGYEKPKDGPRAGPSRG